MQCAHQQCGPSQASVHGAASSSHRTVATSLLEMSPGHDRSIKCDLRSTWGNGAASAYVDLRCAQRQRSKEGCESSASIVHSMTDADDRLLSQEIAHVVAALRLFIMYRRLLIVCFASSSGHL
jgi:hypothetical protein